MINSYLIKFLLIVFVFSKTTNASCQEVSIDENLETTARNYIKKAYNFGMEKEFDSANFYSKKAVLLSERSKNPELISYINLYDSKITYWQAKTIQAKQQLEKNINSEEISDTIKTKTHLLYGEIYKYEKNYPASLKSYINAEKKVINKPIFSKNDSTRAYEAYMNIGDIHQNLKNYNKAKIYFEKALDFVPDSKTKSWVLYKTSNVFKENKDLPKSLALVFNATNLASENEWQLVLPTYYSSISDIYIKMNKADSAIFYAKKGLYNNTYCRLNWLNVNVGRAYMIKKDYSKAIAYFETALDHTTPDETLEVYENLREIYKKTKNYKSALDQNDLYLKLKDSLDNLKVRQEISEITEKFESDKKELKIENLNENQKLNSRIIKKQKTQIFLFCLLLIISAISLGLIIFFYLRQKKQKHLLFIKNRDLAKKIESKVAVKKKLEKNIIQDNKLEEINERIIKLIDTEFYLNNEITLSKMAKKVNTNTTYLSKIINEKYNKSFSIFINDYRISYTLKKLETDIEYRKLTIEHIGEKAGFTSTNAFYRAFKNFTGLTPSYYIRKRIEQN